MHEPATECKSNSEQDDFKKVREKGFRAISGTDWYSQSTTSNRHLLFQRRQIFQRCTGGKTIAGPLVGWLGFGGKLEILES